MSAARDRQAQQPEASLGCVLEGDIELGQQHPDGATAGFRMALATGLKLNLEAPVGLACSRQSAAHRATLTLRRERRFGESA